MNSSEVRPSQRERTGDKALFMQGRFRFGNLQGIGIKANEVSGGKDSLKKATRVATKTQRAINADLARRRIENFENFIDHDRHMPASRGLTRGENTSNRIGIALKFLVFLIKPSRVLTRIARPSAVRSLLVQSSLYFLFDPRALETE
jgi:hypothetical protein